ncbi:SurA N-terminal domain-containing protein [Acinetobacter gerneri]|jgi:peptidyl-prolyl cis-trans isomerase D|uniref:SurA N-terminal domain-containing protein n=1 Tax=Acinetobacter gerneri TaxID=202952 RepID=UPI0023F33BB5|nr:SurA N-terminal domain-containing protein [Acinetobacter gerneri]MCH4242681.1 SurA N-terminal domain-containing protein [Acinetobacter gerneri]
MESFRNLIRGWFGKLLLVLFLVPFAVIGIEGYFSNGNSADVATTVNGQAISKKELDNVTQNLKNQFLQLPAINGDETLLNQNFIKENALNSLVGRTLLLQQAKKLGISLSDEQIKQMIAQQPDFQQGGKFSEALYENYLRNNGLKSQGLIDNIRQDHALKMLSTTIMGYSLVSKTDLARLANLQTEQRSIYLANINLDEYKKNINVTGQDIVDYYNKHKNSFKQVASADVDYVVLTPAQVQGNTAPVTDAELQQAYAKFVEEQKKAAKKEVHHIMITVTDTRKESDAHKLANDVYAKIKAGMTFAAAAAQYSDDTESKANGGLISYVPGAYSQDFDAAVSGLKTGEISQPVKTQYGYHIIETNVQQVNVPSLDAKKAELTAEILKNRNANLYSDTVNNINEQVVGNDALDPVTQTVKSTQIQSVKAMNVFSHVPVLSDPAVKAKIFSDEVKQGDRNASSNIQLANGDTVWVKVRQYYPAGVQPLKNVAAQVKAKIINEKAYAAAKAKIATTLTQFKTEPAEQVVAKSGLKFQFAGEYSRMQQALRAPIQRAAFSVAAPKAGMWSVTTTDMQNELIIVAVSNVKKNGLETLSSGIVENVRQQAQGLRGEQDLDDYLQYLKSHAKIK